MLHMVNQDQDQVTVNVGNVTVSIGTDGNRVSYSAIFSKFYGSTWWVNKSAMEAITL